ncbi:MAG: MFS transporter [Sandaracinaceae bacterium]
MRAISRTVWILSLVSLFTDMASEMLYPVMPIYLRSIGFGVFAIGVLEGVAEATAGLSKGYFGVTSDRSGRRVPFVQLGYALSALSKPLMAVLTAPLWVFLARTIDRLGKGIRTGARDALLSDEATPETKGRVFGLHRAMDTLGAVLGPSLAILYLWLRPGDYAPLFLLALGPGLVAVFLTLLLRDTRAASKTPTKPVSLLAFVRYWRTSPAAYRRLAGGLLFFALFNSSDVFLLMQARAAGLDDAGTIGAYVFYNLVYALASFPLGALADRVGLKPVLLGGLALFALVYLGMARASEPWMVGVLFFLYGVYAASTEGIAKAWVSNVVPASETASAIGTFAGFQSLCALGASSLAGALWHGFGATVTFVVTAVATLVVLAYVAVLVPGPTRT